MKYLVKNVLLALGMLIALVLRPKNNSGLFFFFPFYHIGGAEKVHADILSLVSDRNPWIIICARSTSSALKKSFAESGEIINISRFLGNSILWIICIGYFAKIINNSRKPVIFGCNSYFYYELLPYLKAHVYCIDLLHAFGGGIEYFCIPRVPRLNRRVVIDMNTFENIKAQYASVGLGPELLERVDIVQNKIDVPEERPIKNSGEKIQVFYVGRGTEEKRVYLVGKIARMCAEQNIPAEFTLVGDVIDAVYADDRQYCTFRGEIHNQAKINECYNNADVVLITSSREGFPMAVMEAMAYGVVPVTTDVGGISHHIKNGINGFLVVNGKDEEIIVAGFTGIIMRLQQDRDLLTRTSEAAYSYAFHNFGHEQFDSYYHKLFSI